MTNLKLTKTPSLGVPSNNDPIPVESESYAVDPCLYGRYDLYDDGDIADFFLRNRLYLVAVNADDDLPVDKVPHIGKYALFFAQFHLDLGYFEGPRDAFEYCVSHQFLLNSTIAFVANHIYHEEAAKSTSVEQETSPQV